MGCVFALLTRLSWAEKCLRSRLFTNPLFGPFVLGLLIATFVPQLAVYPKFLQPAIQSFLVALFINCIVRTPESRLSRFLDWAPVALVGRLSYSLYLWQQLFCLLTWPNNPSLFVRLPLNLIPIIFFATLSYIFIERPLFKLRARFRPR